MRQDRGKVMVITGASSGIGRATALAWARQGGTVVLAARSREVLEEVAQICKEVGGEALAVPTDVSKEEEVIRLAEAAVSAFGKIDVWLNDAAVLVFGELIETPTEAIHRILDTNLLGTIYGARAAVRQFRKQGRGTLINMGSLAGIVGQPYSTPYSISKAGIRALGISLGQELAGEEHIHVCTVHPSIIDTPVFQNAANYSGQAVNPPTSATPVEEVVDAILDLTEHPQREVFVGKRNLLFRVNRSLFPELFDKVYQKTVKGVEFRNQSVPTTQGNLFEPLPEQAGISGGWLAKEKAGNRITVEKLAGRAAVVAGLLIGAGWLLSKGYGR